MFSLSSHYFLCPQIYYLEDSTAEWLSIGDEYVFVAEAMVMARMRYVRSVRTRNKEMGTWN